MSRKITRRNLTRGALWTAPAVLASTAIPAYAASGPDYSVDDIESIFTGYSVQNSLITGGQDNNCSTTLTVDTSQYTPAVGDNYSPYLAPGFSIGVINPDEGADLVGKIAHLNSLYYYVAVPKNLTLESISDDTRANWVLDDTYRGTPETFPRENYSGNSIFDDGAYQEDLKAYGGYNFFRFRYVGDTWSLPLRADNSQEGNSDNTWPGSPIRLTFSGSAKAVESVPGRLDEGMCLNQLLLASGYVFSASVEEADAVFENRTLARKDVVTP